MANLLTEPKELLEPETEVPEEEPSEEHAEAATGEAAPPVDVDETSQSTDAHASGTPMAPSASPKTPSGKPMLQLAVPGVPVSRRVPVCPGVSRRHGVQWKVVAWLSTHPSGVLACDEIEYWNCAGSQASTTTASTPQPSTGSTEEEDGSTSRIVPPEVAPAAQDLEDPATTPAVTSASHALALAPEHQR